MKRSDGAPSGNIAVRVPSSVHARLLDLAEKEGVSLNQLVLTMLSEGIGRHERFFPTSESSGKPEAAS